jgi:hypothetical protein
MKFKILTVLLLLVAISQLKAQMYVGGQLSMSYLFGYKALPGIGVHLTTPIKEQPFEFAFNYHLPTTLFEDADPAYARDGSGEHIAVPYKFKVSMFDIGVTYRWYFGDAEMDEGGFYGLGGLTIGVAKATTVYEKYDETKYNLDVSADELSAWYSQPYLSLGLGYDHLLGNDHMIGAQFILNLNATSFNSQTGASGDPDLPSTIGLKVNYSIPIGD